MAHLKLNEQNQIVLTTEVDGQVELMEGQYTVAWVEGTEIKMWGCMDANGLIDSTQFYHSDAGLTSSSDMDEAQIVAATATAINFLKTAKGRKVYNNGVEQ